MIDPLTALLILLLIALPVIGYLLYTNKVIVSCKETQFKLNGECIDCTKCGEGEWAYSQCTDKTDTVCYPCKSCSYPPGEKTPCTLTSDAVCN